MILTKKKAIDISIELWTWFAETGADRKSEWEGWQKYGKMRYDCSLCEYDTRHRPYIIFCGYCPYYLKFGHCSDYRTPYRFWMFSNTTENKKKHAQMFLDQLLQLRSKGSKKGD